MASKNARSKSASGAARTKAARSAADVIRTLTGSGMSNYLENAILNHFLRNVATAAPATVYLGLFTAAPGETGGGTEVSGGGYARQAVPFAAPDANGQVANSAQVTFPVATANWGTVAAFGIFDAAAAGNLLFYGNLGASKVIDTNDQLTFPASSITVQVD